MSRIYDILFTLGFFLASPYYFYRLRRRGNWMSGFSQRFGRYNAQVKQAITNRQVLWFHAVSVGEVNLCAQLIKAIEPRLPNIKIVVSTTTSTGMAQLRSRLPKHITPIYYPIDRRRYVARALAIMHPAAIVLVEAEIWPNFISRAQSQGMPLFLVNARLSDRSFRRYKRFSFLFQKLFAAFDGVGAQNEADAARLRELGCRPEAIRVVGSLKYDAAKLPERRLIDVPKMLKQLGVPDDAQILLGGSTHAGEEAILADAYVALKKQYPKLFLIIVPRHFERSREVGRALEERKIRFVYRGEITRLAQYEPGTIDCLLVNSTGELTHFYEHASIVFVGKSLTAQGGQNPIEPGALGKPLLFGPHMQNFAEISSQFVQRNAALQVHNPEELKGALAQLLAEPGRCEQMGLRAKEVISENLGAIERTVDMILTAFDDGRFYIVRD